MAATSEAIGRILGEAERRRSARQSLARRRTADGADTAQLASGGSPAS